MTLLPAREAVSSDALQVAIKARTYRLLADWLDTGEAIPATEGERIEWTIWNSALDGYLIQTAGEFDQLCALLVLRCEGAGPRAGDDVALLEVLDPLTVAAIYYALPADARDRFWIEASGYLRGRLDAEPADVSEAVKLVAEFAHDPEPPDEIASEFEASQTEWRKWRAGLTHELTSEEVATAEFALMESADLFAVCSRGGDVRAWFEERFPGVQLPDDETEDA